MTREWRVNAAPPEKSSFARPRDLLESVPISFFFSLKATHTHVRRLKREKRLDGRDNSRRRARISGFSFSHGDRRVRAGAYAGILDYPGHPCARACMCARARQLLAAGGPYGQPPIIRVCVSPPPPRAIKKRSRGADNARG